MCDDESRRRNYMYMTVGGLVLCSARPVIDVRNLHKRSATSEGLPAVTRSVTSTSCTVVLSSKQVHRLGGNAIRENGIGELETIRSRNRELDILTLFQIHLVNEKAIPSRPILGASVSAVVAPRWCLAWQIRARARIVCKFSVAVAAAVDLDNVNLVAIMDVVAVAIKRTQDAVLLAEDRVGVLAGVWGAAHGNPYVPILSSEYLKYLSRAKLT
jgi:hypothetical protein